MGTDIYLYWNNMTDKEKEKQYIGFSISGGQVGYLRASIGMRKENSILRAIFPNRYWETKEENGLEYDFKGNWAKVQKAGAIYLLSILFDKELPYTKEQEKQLRIMNGIISALKEMYSEDKIETTNEKENNLPFAIMWLNSLFEFFMLGIEKQEKGLKPRVIISW